MITGNDISVVVPVIRPEKAEKCFASVREHLKGAEIVTEVDTDRIGCPKMVQKLVSRTSRDWVMFLGDDACIRSGFLSGIQEAFEIINKHGVIGLHTQKGNDHAHWLAHKAMLDILPDHAFFSPVYEHCFCDDELKDIALENNLWCRAENALVEHDHPVNTNKTDETYHAAYSKGRWQRDQKTYWQRKRKRLNKTAIGFPLVDEHIPVQFFMSYVCMDKPSRYTLLVPDLPHGPWAGNLADARNSIVLQALTEGASQLFMLDTDQVYPEDTLTKLLAHDVDICGALVHKRWMPFNPVLLRGDIGRYESVSDEDIYSGNLVNVDATGTGALRIKMELFDHIEYPWFEFQKTDDGRPVGEDISFCSKARKSGANVFVDTSIKVGHLATIEINEMFYKLFKRLMEGKKDGG